MRTTVIATASSMRDVDCALSGMASLVKDNVHTAELMATRLAAVNRNPAKPANAPV